MLEKYTLDYLRNTPESSYFERKSASLKPKDIIRPVIAFANANGGTIAVGIEDDGTLTGFFNTSYSVDDYIDNIRRYCRPIPQFETDRISFGQHPLEVILLISIEPSSYDVVKSDTEKVFLRINSSSRELVYSEISQLELLKGVRSFEDIEIRDATLDDLDTSLIAAYKKQLNVPDKDDLDLLKARGLYKNNHLTNAAILLFGKNPTQFLPQAKVKFIRYDGNTPQTGQFLNIIKEKLFESPIPKLIPELTDFIKSQLRDFQSLSTDGTFTSIPEYPEFAWFEGVVNAITHRDYSIAGDYIKILMYDDHLEILSPGKLPNIVTIENMKYTRYSRNPKIARILSDFRWVKELNEGVNRIYNEMQRFFLSDPIYSEPNDNSVQLILKNSILSRILRDKDQLQKSISNESWKILSQNEKIILHQLYTRKQLTTKEAAEILERSLVTARAILKSLLEKGHIELVRTSTNDPSQHYILSSNKH